MAEFKDYFSSNSDNYKRYRPNYPLPLFRYLRNLAPTNRYALDVACGNGQATLQLARHFEKVSATDASAAQVAQAKPADNIEYHVCAAETISEDNNSLDLITVAQAIHWLDHEKFFAQVERTLKPKGVLAIWGYQFIRSNSPDLDDLVQLFHSDIVGAYWPPERALLDESYSQIPFPYQREVTPKFNMEVSWSIEQFCGYLNTWSAVKRFEAEKKASPLEIIKSDLIKLWGKDLKRTLYWPLILYVGIKP